MSQPDKRHKNHCKNLMDYQIMALFAKKVAYKDFKGAYCDEQLDRQVLWILKKIPELDFENKKLKGKSMGVKEEERSKISFECGKTGFYLSVFFVKLNATLENVGGQAKNIDDISKQLDDNFGCLGFDLENNFQQQIFGILKVDDFQKYYKELELDRAQTQEALNDMLVKAVKSSRAKGYHGQEHDSQMPEVYDQAEQRAVKLLQQVAHVKIETEEIKDTVSEESTNSQGNKSRVKIHVKGIKTKEEFAKGSNEKWREVCMLNYDFISQKINSHKDSNNSAAFFAKQHDWEALNIAHMSKTQVVERNDKLVQERKEMAGDIRATLNDATVIQQYDEKTFGFRQLFVKLAFEQLIQDLDLTHNFEMIYEFIKEYQADLKTLKLRIIDKSSLKSNHYWLMAILPKLKSLKHLTIYRGIENFNLGKDFYKFLVKAFTYFKDNGCSLDSLTLSYIHNRENTIENDYLYSVLKNIPDVQLLNFTHTPLCLSDCKAIGKVLSDFKNIRELVLTDTKLTTQNGKEIADGLMRAKQLEILRINLNNLDVSSLIYNLAFSPKIKLIDISKNNQSRNANVMEAFFKLLKISGSIESLIMSNTDLSIQITEDFANALGQNKTLQHLFLDSSEATVAVPGDKIKLLLKGVAMNNYKNGSLTHLSVNNKKWDLPVSFD